METAIENMWWVKGKLRDAYQNAVATLVAAGIAEDDAKIAASDALERLREDLQRGPG